MKLASWNVNGIRAAQKNGFLKWFEDEAADIVCLQEIKAFPTQLEPALLHPGGFFSHWNSAVKPGYSGVALFSRTEPLSVRLGIGAPEIDCEGRVLVAEYPRFTLVNAYFPNSQRDHARLNYKLDFCRKILEYCQKLRRQGEEVVICGDFNIAHKEIDLKNPKSNQDNAGFLPEERAWMDELLEKEYVDSFRHFTKDPGHYTWWSYRPGVREKNIGWRLDYHVVSAGLEDRLKRAEIRCQTRGSDHCPVVLELK